MYIRIYIHIYTCINKCVHVPSLKQNSSCLSIDRPMVVHDQLVFTGQIPARCPLFSSSDRANDYAHSPIVAPLSPPRLSCALRPTPNAQSALSHPGMSMVRSPLSLLPFSLFRPM